MNNDLISREALKKAIRKRLCISSLEYLTEQEKVIVEEIDNAPTVPLPDFKEGYKQAILDGKTNSSRPQGEWIFDSEFTEFGYPYGTYRCSVCGGHSSNKYSFCKDCGAKMDKE